MAEHAGLIPIGQAARLLMISEERIRQLVKQGFIPKPEKRGFVQLVGAVQGYLRYLKDDERRSAKSVADSRVRYARALEMLTGKKVQEKYIYLFQTGETLKY